MKKLKTLSLGLILLICFLTFTSCQQYKECPAYPKLTTFLK